MKHIGILFPVLLLLISCSTSKVPADELPDQLNSNPGGEGQKLEISVTRGEAHNHPSMAIWVEDPEGSFIQTLFVSESIGKGVFRHGDTSEGFWQPGEIRRPAALPYWGHKRGIRAEDGLYLPSPLNPVADAYTGPTPQKSFVLSTRLDRQQEGSFRVLLEINQTWDWNDHWTNNKYPDDAEYKSSCQPALVYEAFLETGDPGAKQQMYVIGRSHHSGKNGELYEDLHTMSTALNILSQIDVRIIE